MKYAKIINGIVDNVSYVKMDGYIECPDDIAGGATYDGQKFVNPSIPEYQPSKDELLNSLVVTLSNGLRFYADPQSRTDIAATIIEAQNQNATDEMTTNWKTPDGVKLVTLKDLKDANALALNEKAKIIGVI